MSIANINKLYYGETAISKVMYGETVVYEGVVRPNYIQPATLNINTGEVLTTGIPDDYYVTFFIKVQPSSIVHYECLGTNNVYNKNGLVWYDANKNFISSYRVTNWAANVDLTAPDNAEYVRATFRTGKAPVLRYKGGEDLFVKID